MINPDVRKAHKEYNSGLLKWILTPPKAKNGVSFLSKPVAGVTILENKVNSCFGLSIENQHQTQWKEPEIEIPTVQSYIIEDLTSRVLPVPKQNPAALVPYPESIQIRAKITSILETDPASSFLS